MLPAPGGTGEIRKNTNYPFYWPFQERAREKLFGLILCYTSRTDSRAGTGGNNYSNHDIDVILTNSKKLYLSLYVNVHISYFLLRILLRRKQEILLLPI